jgi:hypothetical protein
VLNGEPMEPVAVRNRRAKPVPVGDRLIAEWHVAQFELHDDEGAFLGYRSYCGRNITLADAIVEPGRTGAFCEKCASHNRLPAAG